MDHPPRPGGPCACGASGWGLPPGRCSVHAWEDERDWATRALALARRGMRQARRLAARHPDDPVLLHEAREWLAEARDDAAAAAATLATPPRPAQWGPGDARVSRPTYAAREKSEKKERKS